MDTYVSTITEVVFYEFDATLIENQYKIYLLRICLKLVHLRLALTQVR